MATSSAVQWPAAVGLAAGSASYDGTSAYESAGTRPPATGPDLLPVADGLAGLFPYGGPVRGSVVSLDSPAVALALLAPVSAAGSWCAVSGFPALGLAAAAAAGIDLHRFVVVPDPGEQWAATVATLLDGFEAVLVRPPDAGSQAGGGNRTNAAAAQARRLATRARERRSTLVVLGDWPHQVDLHLRLEHSAWQGLEHGYGRLTGRQCALSSSGRGAGARERRVSAWFA